MNRPHNEHGKHDAPPGFWSSRHAIGLMVTGGVAAYFLLTEHLAHVVEALPYLLLLACPLMHFFMHRHHHGGHGHPGPDETSQSPDKPPRKPGEPS